MGFRRSDGLRMLLVRVAAEASRDSYRLTSKVTTRPNRNPQEGSPLPRRVGVHGLSALRQFPGSKWLEIAMIRMNHKRQSHGRRGLQYERAG
jgi:hypothetical protein